jgi:predicted enzyme related to lactoylglutathione lyase
MHLAVVSVNVNDIERARTFYVDALGFEVRRDEPMPEGKRWIMLAPPNAQTSIALIHGIGNWTPEAVGGETGHSFEVDDVFTAHANFVQRGVEFTAEPRNEYFGGWAQFKDTEGNIFGLYSPALAEAAP